jgi:ribosomal protein L9
MQEELLMKSLATLEGTVITLKEKANEEGHLYAKVQAPELIKALKAQAGIDLQSDHLTSKEPLKAVGEHTVDIEVQGKKSSFKVVIEAL